MKNLKKFSILIVLLFACKTASAQEIFVSSSVNSVDYTASSNLMSDISLLKTQGHGQISDFLNETSSNGRGFSLCLGGTFPIDKAISISPGINFKSRNAVMVSNSIYPYLTEINGKYQKGNFRFTSDINLNWISLDVTGDVKLFPDCYLMMGAEIGMINTHSYSFRIEAAGEFDTQNIQDTSGTFTNTNKTIYSVEAGLRYDIKLSKMIKIAPHISYEYGLTNIVSTSTWKVNSLAFGLSAYFRIPD